ncbi:hypothetical protein HNP46_006095 [Pseudomonas nitritireducens]|uniref:Uncharacterized protein n=1 Tax=Pseudomonas nitroreducens TaxID=46680 RepID=A0A7W7P4S0_PSENT|nr:hypothetical protein [Pseudomonas nitritireducens]MBB4867184.1 hypothetical protein [Pseudomonas nitritireducens]
MLIQHLIITQLKSVFFRGDNKAICVDGGLSTQEAEELGLIPMIILGICVEGLQAWHAKLHPTCKEINLGEFLFDSWMDVNRTWGVPDVLKVDKELIGEFPLLLTLKKICGESSPRISPTSDRHVGASKRFAQELAKFAVNTDMRSSGTRNDLFAQLNSALEEYNKYSGFGGFSDKRSRIVADLINRELKTPIGKPAPFMFIPSAWSRVVADKKKSLPDGQKLYITHESEGAVFLCPDYDHDFLPKVKGEWRHIARTPGYIWDREEPGLKYALQSIAYPVGNMLEKIVDLELFEEFKAGRGILPEVVADDIRKAFFSESLVIIPKNLKSLRGAYEYITGLDVEWSGEIKRYDLEFNDIRIYIVVTMSPDILLIVIPRTANINHDKIPSMLNEFRGDIDLGAGGYAAVAFWAEQCNKFRSENFSWVLLCTVDAMLRPVEDLYL